MSPTGSFLGSVFLGMVALSFTAAAAQEQSAWDADTHWNVDPADDIFKFGTFKELDERGVPVGWNDMLAKLLNH